MTHLVLGLSVGIILLYEFKSKTFSKTIYNAHKRGIHCMANSCQDLVTACYGGVVKFWSLPGLVNFATKKMDEIVTLSMCNADKTVLVQQQYQVVLLSMRSAKTICKIDTKTKIQVAAMNSDSFFLVHDGIKQYSKDTLQCVQTFSFGECNIKMALCYQNQVICFPSGYALDLATKSISTADDVLLRTRLAILNPENEDELICMGFQQLVKYNFQTKQQEVICSDPSKASDMLCVYKHKQSYFVAGSSYKLAEHKWNGSAYDIAAISLPYYQNHCNVRSMTVVNLLSPGVTFVALMLQLQAASNYTDVIFQ